MELGLDRYFTEQRNMIEVQKKQINDLIETVSSIRNEVKNLQQEKSQLEGKLNHAHLRIDTTEAEVRCNKERVDSVQIDVSNLVDKTSTIEFDDTRTLAEIRKEVNKKVTCLLGGKTTPQYQLFSKVCFRELNGRLVESLAKGKRIGAIKTEDAKGAFPIIKNYTLNRRTLTRHIQECLKKEDRGHLPESKSKIMEDAIEWFDKTF